MVTRKPRYSEQMESGVLYFMVRGNTHGKRYGIESGVEPKPLTIITQATKTYTESGIYVSYLLINRHPSNHMMASRFT